MRSSLSFIATFLPNILAYPQINSPRGGSSWNTGSVTVQWSDKGSPSVDQLSGYTLELMVGGNEASNSQSVATIVKSGTFSPINKATGTLDPGVAGPVDNGFFLKMTCAAVGGGQLVVYSDRFSIPSLSGKTPDQLSSAASSLQGNTAGPTIWNGIHNRADVADAVAPAAPAAADAGLPYTLQTGLIKYAPMQSIPPTKITAKTASPLYPTSAVTVATTFLPLASVTTTVTPAQTFVVSSMENTAAAQSGPSDDMAKFLARWKD